ncbi:MAG: hypothetical protein QM758_08290 [Armatimonas sp.]
MGDPEPAWTVTLKDRTDIMVRDKTGFPLSIYIPTHSDPDKGIKRPDKALETTAKKYLEIFSSAGQLAATYQLSGLEINSHEVHRDFSWARTLKGVPMVSQDALIAVNTVSGELVIASLRGWGPLPTNDIGKVSKARAQELAVQKVREKFKGVTPQKVEADRIILERNRYWIDGNEATVPELRFIWMVLITLEKKGHAIFVGVDSQTEEIVYGAAVAPHSHAP